LNELTGLTVPPADPSALAVAISRLLDHPEQRASFGAAARERARKEFSLESMAARTAALYDRLIAANIFRS
jgi:glycosyltransferase involved in cell wall biosynthesis